MAILQHPLPVLTSKYMLGCISPQNVHGVYKLTISYMCELVKKKLDLLLLKQYLMVQLAFPLNLRLPMAVCFNSWEYTQWNLVILGLWQSGWGWSGFLLHTRFHHCTLIINPAFHSPKIHQVESRFTDIFSGGGMCVCVMYTLCFLFTLISHVLKLDMQTCIFLVVFQYCRCRTFLSVCVHFFHSLCGTDKSEVSVPLA